MSAGPDHGAQAPAPTATMAAPGEPASPDGPPWCDGAELRAVLLAATAWLERQAGAVNALNVFPVPDGDTGTNMALTMRAAVRDLVEEATAPATAAEVAAVAAHGALMGARGNSGVILSQLLRGFARGIEGLDRFDGAQLAQALTAAAALGYQAVLQPVEGTILTVAREAAEAAVAAAAERNDVWHVTIAALAGARAALRRTPELLDILRQAGVVDAGGQGLVVLLDGIVKYRRGDLDLEAIAAAHPAPVLNLAAVHAQHPDDYGYCTNFMIAGDDLPFAAIRDHLAGVGHSAVIVGDDRLIKVHLHTPQPGAALEYAVQFGRLSQIKIDNMDEQHAEFARGRGAEERRSRGAEVQGNYVAPLLLRSSAPPLPSPQPPAPIGLVAVASGEGCARLLASLGAGQIVAGGQTMNPSAEALLAAIEALPQDEVVLLPNNGNVVMAARQAAGLTGKRVAVVPSASLPQGVAALLAFSPAASLAANLAAMGEAIARVRTGEVTCAVRSVTLDGVAVAAGQMIALIDDRLIAADADRDTVVLALLAALQADRAELITLYYGATVGPADRGHVERLIAARYPDQTLELVEGGQPHYDFIVTVE